MPTELDVGQSSVITSTAVDFSPDAETTDGATGNKETTWDFSEFSTELGYFEEIPEYRQSIKALANWTVGRGYEAENSEQKIILEHVIGWGEDTFDSIMWNMMCTKKWLGDAMAHIIRDEKSQTLLNLKPLPMDVMRTVANSKGMILRYEQLAKLPNGTVDKGTVVKKFKPKEILHLVNDRTVDSIHGTSLAKSVRFVMDARNEAMRDKRRVLHNSSIRVIEVDSENRTKINSLKADYAEAIKKGDVLIVPKDTVSFPSVPDFVHASDNWIQYLENTYYLNSGVPKVILGGSSDFTEASSKTAYVTFEQVWGKEQRELEMDLLNQMNLRIKFIKPASFIDDTQQQEQANQAQTGFQPNDTNIGGAEIGQQTQAVNRNPS